MSSINDPDRPDFILMPPEEYEPLQRKAVLHLAHHVDSVDNYNELAEALGLDEIVCQMKPTLRLVT